MKKIIFIIFFITNLTFCMEDSIKYKYSTNKQILEDGTIQEIIKIYQINNEKNYLEVNCVYKKNGQISCFFDDNANCDIAIYKYYISVREKIFNQLKKHYNIKTPESFEKCYYFKRPSEKVNDDEPGASKNQEDEPGS